MKLFSRHKNDQNDPYEGIGLGDIVQDTFTGFLGTVTARAEHLTGCNQVFVLPASEKVNEMKDGAWFDIERIEKLEDSKVKFSSRRTGADTPMPRTQGARL